MPRRAAALGRRRGSCVSGVVRANASGHPGAEGHATHDETPGGAAVRLCLGLAGCERAGDSGNARSDAPAAGESSVTALVGATLIDGTGAAPLADAVVLIEGTEITAAGVRADVAVPEGARTVDVGGKWLVPGLIDAHVHFMESGRIYTKPGQINLTHLVPYDEEVAWMQQRVPVTLTSYLCAGVTGAVSVGGPRFEYEVRGQARARPDAPDVYVAHGPVTLVPAQALFPPFDGDTSVRSVTDPASAAETIRQGAEWKADLVKTGYLGGPFAVYEQDYAAVHEAIVAEAAVHGLPVTSHVTELAPARTLIELGVDSLQHLPLDAPLDEAFLDLAKASGVVVCPPSPSGSGTSWTSTTGASTSCRSWSSAATRR